jgi:hypothetical protein
VLAILIIPIKDFISLFRPLLSAVASNRGAKSPGKKRQAFSFLWDNVPLSFLSQRKERGRSLGKNRFGFISKRVSCILG